MRRTAGVIALVLAGCGPTRPDPPPQVRTVTVTVERTVKVPAPLTRDCDEVPKQGNDYAEAKRLANARKASLDECTGRMREIRKLGEAPTP